MEFDITGNLNLNTQNAEQQLNSFLASPSNYVPLLGDNNNSASLVQTAQQKTTEGANRLNDSFADLQDEMKNVLESFKVLCMQIDKTAATAGVDWSKTRKDQINNVNNASKGKIPTPAQGVIGVAEGASNVVSNVANGNIGGALIGGVSSTGNTALQGAGIASAAGLSAVAGALTGVGIAALLGGAALKGGNALAEKYEEALPDMDKILSNFGGNISERSRNSNMSMALGYRSSTLDAYKGSNLTYSERLALTNSLGAYGITDINVANAIGSTSAILGNYTNTDPNKIASFGGMIQRYGGNGAQAINDAFGAARASGLERNQFGEFLDGLQRVVETGISKGFIQSSEEVATNLGMLARLSDNNPLWQGKNGAERYMQMMNTASTKTDLNSTTSLLMARAANDLNAKDKSFIKNTLGEGGYLEGDSVLNTLAFMEQGGMTGKFMESFRNRLQNTYGNDIDSQVGAIKEAYGLNYAGSIQLYNMMNKIGTNGYDYATFEKEAKAMKESGQFDSDNKRMVDILTEINKKVVDMSKPMFDVKIGGLEKVSNAVEKIYTFMIGDSARNTIKKATDGFFNHAEKDEKKAFIDKAIEELQKGNVDGFYEMVDWMNSADEATKNWYNDYNRTNDIFDPNKRQSHSDYESFLNPTTKPSKVGDTIPNNKFIKTTEDIAFELMDKSKLKTPGEQLAGALFSFYNDNYNLIGEDIADSEKSKIFKIASEHVNGGKASAKEGFTFDNKMYSALLELVSLAKDVAKNKNITINLPTGF